MKWIYLTIAIIGEVIATSALKSSEGITKPIPSTIVIIGYGLAFYSLSITLQSISVGVAYAIWAGVGTLLITLVGYFFFQQKLDMPAVFGLTLIVAGVIVINLFSKSISH
ncbi:MAG TPA: multidrug efflux SMR transporter [Leptospiraceae bacterium]|nr:multidrug efflux SMR transporter [Leptospiraceae bacterium]HMW06094.1 multidrug efflux SMR transporter [Leptospiraceae bacterium]HMX30778.1 multidrug efflux SMR transporter [Leptospiraceae bacterium]HMY31756.1 multidrug efflux SMR transporter [Leptospiraceae bacterium]HMZ63087.1 multidrug efflux SMR transporter [Leptospiraceae bacterium]